MKNTTIITLLGLLLAISSCRPSGTLPTKSSPQYNELVRTFYIGLAALEVGHDVQADAKLAQFTQLAAPEPAGWANWGLLALRQRNYDTAAERFNKARDLAPDNSQIFYLIGLLESSRGNTAEAITALRKSVELDQNNLIAVYKLAEEVERQGDEKSAEEFQSLIQKILVAQPDNLAALVEQSRIAAKRNDAETFKSAVTKIVARSSSWPDEVREQVNAVDALAKSGDLRNGATRTSFLRNVLMRVPEYRRNLAAIKPPPGEEAIPFDHFLKLESPTFTTAPADTAITFKPEPLPDEEAHGSWIGAISLSGEGAPVIATATAKEVRLASGATMPFPGPSLNSSMMSSPTSESILPVDFNYDFKTDLVLAGQSGVRFFKQESPSAFTDVTRETKLPPTILDVGYSKAWSVDIEADGDLDIVLGGGVGAPPVLRNNGDGTFLEIHPFANISPITGFAWADLDADGDPDAAVIDDKGKLHVFSNERQGQFTERPVPDNGARLVAVQIMDVDNDGVLDLVVCDSQGVISRYSDKDKTDWTRAEIAKRPQAVSETEAAIGFDLKVADLDNNGGLDLVMVSGLPSGLYSPCQPNCNNVWLNNGNGKFDLLQNGVPKDRVLDIADVNNDGRLDLLGVSDSGPYQAINQSTKNYHWQIVRPRASNAVGDQRINPFGVGGEMEIRSGMTVQKQPITGPLIHFGLGEQASSDVIRVVWPNGTVRAEFEIKADQEVLAEQRLKASCPWLFAWNGKQMEFVKDAVPWGSAIGLRINTLGSAKIAATGEWYKIRRDQLVPHDGYYDIRVTAELWEVYYYDYIGLMPIDHPEGTEIFVDERFVVPPAKLGFTTVATPKPIKQAIDDDGNDVTSLLSARDGKALDNFGRGQFQGLTRDHYVEVDLGDEAPTTGPLYLIAHGSIHDTESSVNVAITQGSRWRAKSMSVEIPDGNGGWKMAQENLGFPAGRKKTVLFNLTDLFKPGMRHRVRIRTNLEIYWDHLEWAVGLPDAPVKTVALTPSSVDLHYRGYSVVNKPESGGAPEVPDYYKLFSTKQAWRDLEGYYTRFGEVGELLQKIDDRYVIVASGDEMSFRFPELPAPPAGWVRDFILMGDGWIKDGDYNSTFSRTVQPLPHHAQQEYETPPGKLEDEVVYRRFPEDWQKYHTRYVAPDVFKNVLRYRSRK